MHVPAPASKNQEIISEADQDLRRGRDQADPPCLGVLPTHHRDVGQRRKRQEWRDRVQRHAIGGVGGCSGAAADDRRQSDSGIDRDQARAAEQQQQCHRQETRGDADGTAHQSRDPRA
jgi:hypothetical protein